MSDDVYNKLVGEGFERIERDDRMLDIFPNETREKGIELWDKWNEDTVEIIHIHIPKGKKGMSRYSFSRKELEQALMTHTKVRLK